jgi:hypothetical protein
MMTIKFYFLFLLVLFFPSMTYAFFCPNNFNQIELGNSFQQVAQQCGQPDKKSSKEITEEGAQSWDYYVVQAVLLNDNRPAQGTLRTTVVFDDTGKVINISVNGIGVGSSSVCGPEIKLGDEKNAVKAACGNPVLINKQSQAPEKKHQITEWIYGQTTLLFEDKQLKEKK